MKTSIWLFDLDNTLHRADKGIFYLINRRMTVFLQRRLHIGEAEADRLRAHYWHEYGATLTGLRLHHPEISLRDFLAFSHPMDEILPKLVPEAGTATLLSRLHGRKAVFSNGPGFYVRTLIGGLGLSETFEALFGTDDLDFACKPQSEAYHAVCKQLDVPPEQCILVDDSAGNLHTAKQLGMTTVLFGPQAHELPFADGTARNMAELYAWAERRSLTAD
ncbi:MAG: pyrimidine 5'-nucleotidase [Neisseria sp.]|nr:pyrimidine 5'-nucleotidase [Neisseria sp.]